MYKLDLAAVVEHHISLHELAQVSDTRFSRATFLVAIYSRSQSILPAKSVANTITNGKARYFTEEATAQILQVGVTLFS